MFDGERSCEIALDRLEISLEEGLLSLSWHLLEVFLYKATESLTDDPEPQLNLSSPVLTVNLIKKLAPRLNILVYESF